jgi:hypothetical protein
VWEAVAGDVEDDGGEGNSGGGVEVWLGGQGSGGRGYGDGDDVFAVSDCEGGGSEERAEVISGKIRYGR